ncbi:MAG: glycosyltransferase family 39 protein [Phycisphaerae bacterium]|nr:glycosyltransferase family 39 protein [Phycisphaerae bacterium]
MMGPRGAIPLLLLLCAVICLPGIDTHGVTNWQEAQRLIVARDMQDRGDWMLPTINGRPYLAKPPLIYWCQLMIASLRGGKVELVDLRLTVALAGMLGVLASYLSVRRILLDHDSGSRDETERRAFADRAAFWSAALLATGILYVRSCRIGELDILLVPTVAPAIACLYAACGAARSRPTMWFAAAAFGSLAALAKGPPALLAILIAALGGAALHRASRPQENDENAGAASRWPLIAGGVALPLAAVALHPTEFAPPSPSAAAGAALFAIYGACLGRLLGRLSARAARAGLWSDVVRMNPLVSLGVPVLALLSWSRIASSRIPDGISLASAAEEAEDNLRLLVPDSPVNNIEAAAFGVGLGSALACLFLVEHLRRRPRMSRPLALLLAWSLLGLITFSLLGKGVGRYLTPLWPALAGLAGLWAGRWTAPAPGSVRRRTLLASMVVVLALTQGWWYARGREVFQHARTPAAMIAELLAPPWSIDPASIATFGFRTPAVDYYLGRAAPAYGDTGLRAGIAGQPLLTVEDLRNRLDGSDPGPASVVLLIRRAAIDPLRAAMFHVEHMPVRARFTVDSGRSEVTVVRVRTRIE